ncbi:MAG TPA: hypothetical protein VKD28_00630 [Gemmatimonadales bacterium]|nr:hypothetical protein [Gemmatimonadales bacterium]
MTGYRSAARALLFTATAITVIALPSHAQRAGDGFLFHPPGGSWTWRGGFAYADANSDVFAFVTDQLTIDRLDFASATIGTSLAIRLSGLNDLVFDVGYSNISHGSEFRDWVDNNDQPIEQTTSLRRIPVTVGLRQYITSRGRAIGQFAWIPSARALYVGVGGGMMEYKFSQVGDFIDFKTLNVFHDEFVSQGWTPAAYGAAGLDIGLGTFTMLTTEVRYTWAKAPMSADFEGFNKIDLSGPSVTAGLTFRLY